MKVYSMQHRGANQIIPISLSTPVLQHNLFGPKSMGGSSVKPQPLAGVPILTPVSAVPSKSSLVGTTDLRYFTCSRYHLSSYRKSIANLILLNKEMLLKVFNQSSVSNDILETKLN